MRILCQTIKYLHCPKNIISVHERNKYREILFMTSPVKDVARQNRDFF
jgi:hypothetical protein